MPRSSTPSSIPSNRKSAVEEEQLLCNEALLSGDYENYSEREWQALCEKAYRKGRSSSEKRPKTPTP